MPPAPTHPQLFPVPRVSLGGIASARHGEAVMRRVILPKVAAILLFALPFISRSAATARGQTPDTKSPAPAVSKSELTAFNARLLAATTKHLDQLIGTDTKVAALKG